jgi:hypothetical protein
LSEKNVDGSSNPTTSTGAACPLERRKTLRWTSTNVDSEETVEAGSSKQGAPPTNATKNLSTMREERVQIPQNVPRVNVGLAWKLRAYKMVKYTFLSTIIPSVPMVVSQIVGYIRPDILNETVDTVISLCNIVHAILFPLMFVLTVKC